VHAFKFDPVTLPPNTPAFRQEIREFLTRELPRVPAERRANCWAVFDADFSRKLGARGWIGMVWPKRYGGHERSALERYVLLEELLAAGAPVGAHWIADRQSGPNLLRYGSEQQREKYLPGMARGEILCCIGMSEPGAGSDLAAVRTRAEKLPDGRWRLNGQKIWTSNARQSQLMIALVRTSPLDEKNRHAGLSQFLLELSTPGIRIQPIVDLVGHPGFNEVFFDDVVVGQECLLGVEGAGWRQVTSELSLERSGPERYLSSFALFVELVRLAERMDSETLRHAIGRLTAELWTLRQMSVAVAGMMQGGKSPAIEASLVKDLGTIYQQDLPEIARAIAESDATTEEDMADFLDVAQYATMMAPSYTIQGGTTQVLRGIVARGLGLR